jgi:PKD repeat protein
MIFSIEGYVTGPDLEDGSLEQIDMAKLMYLGYNYIRILNSSNLDIQVSEGAPDSFLTRCAAAAHAFGKKFLLSFEDDTDWATGLESVLADPAQRAILVQNLVNKVISSQADGISIDIERYPASMEDARSQLVADLYPLLHPLGKTISVYGFQDYSTYNSGYKDVTLAAMQYVDWVELSRYTAVIGNAEAVEGPLQLWLDAGYPAAKMAMVIKGCSWLGGYGGDDAATFGHIVDVLNPPTSQSTGTVDGQAVQWNSIDSCRTRVDWLKSKGMWGMAIFEEGYDKLGGDARSMLTAIFNEAGGVTPNPVAGFTYAPTGGNAPLTVQFTDTSTNSPTSWAWAFGDGATSTVKNPSHVYTTPGTYTVTLTVNGGSSASATIVVSSVTPVTYTITATAGANGTITPSGAKVVNSGASQAFTITPAAGYQISDVLVDGVSQGAIASYTFTNVVANHTISASFVSSGGTVVVFEQYLNGPDIDNLVGSTWKAYTFTPTVSHSAIRVSLELELAGTPAGNVTVSIRATDASGKPTGPDLASASIPCSIGTSLAWYDFALSAAVQLTAGVKYAIVIRAPSMTGSNYIWYAMDRAGSYTGGSGYQSSNSGSSWSALATFDCVFKIWGTTTGGFSPGSQHTATVPVKGTPTNVSMQAEVWLGPDSSTKVATSGQIPFTAAGANQNVACPVTMPSAGNYQVFIDLFSGGILFDRYLDQGVTVG